MQAAWVLPLDEAGRAFVHELRQRLAVAAPPEWQLPAHLTLLSLGEVAYGPDHAPVRATLEALELPPLRLRLRRWGRFGPEGAPTNLHLLPEDPEPLVALHRRCFEAARQAGWRFHGGHALGDFVPHVSVVDRPRGPLGRLPELDLSCGVEAPLLLGRVQRGPRR